jgi:AcrR family transcriptional regulator
MSEVEPWVEEMLRLHDEDEKMTGKQIKILQAAVEIFSEKGYAATSTSEIAQKAGVAEGTIFRHYKTKKDLLISIVAPMMSKLIAPFVLRDFYKVLDAEYGRFEDFVRAVIRNRIEFVKNHMPVLKVMIQEIPFHPELKERFAEIVAKHIFERIAKVIRLFQDKGQIVSIPTYQAIRFTGSVVIGMILTHYLLLPDREWDNEKEIEATIRLLMHGLTPPAH